MPSSDRFHITLLWIAILYVVLFIVLWFSAAIKAKAEHKPYAAYDVPGWRGKGCLYTIVDNTGIVTATAYSQFPCPK